MEEESSVILRGKVEKMIPALGIGEPSRAQITIAGAEELYREIRVPSILKGAQGKSVNLQLGDDVEIVIQKSVIAP